MPGIRRLQIRGIEVLFPYDPYKCQLNYMEKVIQCLNESLEDRRTNGKEVCRKNALLESPTGTGKTICLLCASYAWVLDYQRKYTGVSAPPKIIFASRTHSQLAQAIRELKKTPYSPQICILGSRDQMCIHPHVGKMSGAYQNRECISRVSTHTCEFYEHYQAMKNDGTIYNMFHTSNDNNAIPDIEDLILEGNKQQFCPFFYSREVMQSKAEIVFMPYNYLIDPRVRKQVNIDISDSILIFDEAHNLEKWCSDASSFEFNTMCISQSVAELARIVRWMKKDPAAQVLSDINMEESNNTLQGDLERLKEVLLDLDLFINGIRLRNETKSGSYLFDILSEINLKFSTYTEFQAKIRAAINYLENDENGKKLHLRPTGLRNLKEVIDKIFDSRLTEEEFKLFFHMHIEVKSDVHKPMTQDSLDVLNQELESRGKPPKNMKQSIIFNLWCFNPGVAIQSIKNHKPQCFILTSGTLTPMDSFAYELGLNFPIRLENPHVIKPGQISILTAGVGPTNIKLNSSFTNLSDEYCIEIGRLLINISRIVPDGLLVFFPSNTVLSKCIELWRRTVQSKTSIYNSIAKFKTIFTEPSDGSQLQTVMTSYIDAINNSENTAGAIFLAVCRGRVSEGLDFSGRNARCVVIVGMPFPPIKDPKVVLKRQYLDNVAAQRKKETTEKEKITSAYNYDGNEWYKQESSRAVNQAVGRVIRNKYDYGAVILCDERYALQQYKSQLSRWLQKHVTLTRNFGEIVQRLSQFYKKSSEEFGVSSEKLREKMEKSNKIQEEDQQLLPTLVTSRKNLNLIDHINTNPSYRSLHDKEELSKEKEDTKILLNTPAGQYHYTKRENPKTIFNNNNAIISPLSGNNIDSRMVTSCSDGYYFEKASLFKPTADSKAISSNSNNSNNMLNNITHRTIDIESINNSFQNQGPINKLNVQSSLTSESNAFQKKASASLFIGEAKKKLSEGEYKKFKTILKDFQKMFAADRTITSDQFSNLINQILEIFTGDKADLLVGLRQFIPENARHVYDNMTKQTSKKEVASDTNSSISSSSSPSISSLKRKREHYDLLTGSRTKKPGYLPKNSSSSPSPTESKNDAITIDNNDTNLVPEIAFTAPVVPAEFNSILAEVNDSFEQRESGIKCRICFENKQNLANSRCGHVLCMDCWDECLQAKLECPICRERVRSKHLTKIFL